MEKRREPKTRFCWYRDADGYSIAPGGGQIVRRGGRMVEYDPGQLSFALHQVFANIGSQTWARAENEGRPLKDDTNAPFYERGFNTLPDAMLAFVNEFGFLGSDRTGADAEYEDVARLSQLSDELRAVGHWTRLQDHMPPEKAAEIVDTPIPGTKRTEPRYKPKSLHAALEHLGVLETKYIGPKLRMVIGPNARTGRPEIWYEPESLHAWMWLRMAEEMASGIDWSGLPCLYCHQPIGRGPGANRRDAKFCEANHRVYFYRLSPEEQAKRIAEAKGLSQ